MITVNKYYDPMIMLLGCGSAARDAMANILKDRNLRCVDAWRAQENSQADQWPDLVLLMHDSNQMAQIMAIRASPGRLSNVPILACMPILTNKALDRAAIVPPDCDDILPWPTGDVAACVAQIDTWLPPDPMAGARRLATQFGHDQIAPMLERLRDELDEAVRALDGGGAALRAHSIAGVAGTLGFAAVSDSWESLSEGEEGAARDARRTARIAIAAIDRSRRQEGRD